MVYRVVLIFRQLKQDVELYCVPLIERNVCSLWQQVLLKNLPHAGTVLKIWLSFVRPRWLCVYFHNWLHQFKREFTFNSAFYYIVEKFWLWRWLGCFTKSTMNYYWLWFHFIHQMLPTAQIISLMIGFRFHCTSSAISRKPRHEIVRPSHVIMWTSHWLTDYRRCLSSMSYELLT